MTECNRQPMLFASVDRRQIVADFRGGDLTSDGGLPLLREVDRKIGLIDALDAAIRHLRPAALGGVPSPREHRRRQAQPGDPQAAGHSLPPGLAGTELANAQVGTIRLKLRTPLGT